MAQEFPDAWWIERSLEDESAFEEIVHRHYEGLLAFLTRATGLEAGSELAQEVFLTAFESRTRFRLEALSARPWLFGIANNLLRSWYRTEGRRRRAYARLRTRRSDTYEFESGADEKLSAEGVRELLRAALINLPRRDQAPFLLLALGELSYSEISEALGIPIGTVKSRIHRARTCMSDLVGDEALRMIREETDSHG